MKRIITKSSLYISTGGGGGGGICTCMSMLHIYPISQRKNLLTYLQREIQMKMRVRAHKKRGQGKYETAGGDKRALQAFKESTYVI